MSSEGTRGGWGVNVYRPKKKSKNNELHSNFFSNFCSLLNCDLSKCSFELAFHLLI